MPGNSGVPLHEINQTEVVEVLGIEGCIIHIKGLDMISGTPVLDIKPLTEKRNI
jgi:tRNA (Thr-GGU) A37 N-methylase